MALTEVDTKGIKNASIKLEDIENGTSSDNGKFLKNIEPKNIYLRDLPETLLDVLHMGFHVCHHQYGLSYRFGLFFYFYCCYCSLLYILIISKTQKK